MNWLQSTLLLVAYAVIPFTGTYLLITGIVRALEAYLKVVTRSGCDVGS
jgi:hypothetical protein